MAQVYLSQYAKRAGVADSASHVIGGNTIAPTDTYIQYNKKDKFGAEVYFRYIYPIHSFQHGNNTNALGYWSHTEGSTTYTGFNNTFSSSILSGAVTLSAEYGNVTSSFITGDYIYLNDYESDNIFSTAVAKIINTSWDDTSSYVTLDVNNIHATTSFVGSLGTYYIQNPLGNKVARAYIAHSEGEGTYAMGVGAHSEGSGSYAIGKYSHTEGNNTVALGNYQTVVGQYNLFSTSQSAFIIGDGYAKIIDSGTFGNSPTSGSSSFYINSTYSPPSSLTGSIITIVSASSSVSETFIINDVTNVGGGEYEITVNRKITQNYYEDEDTFSILKITRHNLLFASQSYFQISASNIFLQGIPSSSTAPQVLIYDDVTGQVYYTSSAAFGGIGSSPGGPNTSIQYNNNGNFGGAESFTLTSLHGGGTSVVRLTGSMLVSGSITSTGIAPNYVGFIGTASWAQSASNALQAVSASYAPNFANTNLTFTGNRDHHTNGYSYFIYSNLNGMAVSGGYQYFDNDSNSIGVAAGSTNTYTYIEIFTSSIDLSFNANPTVSSAYTFTKTLAYFSSSLNVTKSVFFPGLTSTLQTNVVTINPATGQLYYTSSNALSAVSIPLDIKDDGTLVKSNPTFINFTGSGVSASANDTGVDVYIPIFPPFPFTGSAEITGSVTLTGSMFVSGAIFNVSASNISLKGLSTTSSLTHILIYNTSSGQVYYTASSAIGGGGSTSTGTFSLPVPKVILYNSSSVYITAQSYNPTTGGAGATSAKIYNSPRVITMDITDEMRATHRIFVELVHFKRARRKGGQSYFIPPSHIDSGGKVYINKLAADLGVPLSSRGGKQKWRTNPNVVPAVFADIQVNRPNHYEVTARNQTIPVYKYLNGWFVKGPIYYANTSGGVSTFDSWYPSYRSTVGNSPTGRFAYGATFSPMYVAFRYIAWDANANGGLGAFISGPLSPIVAIGPQIFPFVQDPISTLSLGSPTAYLSQAYIDLPGSYNNNLKCWFVNRLP
jgi:hypothetical protein